MMTVLRRNDGPRMPDTAPDPVDWPQRTFVPGRGWPLVIPPTGRTRYLSGYHALNLPSLPDEPRLGDWHEGPTWWSSTYLGHDARPNNASLWGPNGTLEGAPGPPELRDARPALALAHHPAADDPEPIIAATVAQAILDLAWRDAAHREGGPGRREVVGWTDGPTEAHLRELAVRCEAMITDPAILEKWCAWQAESLAGDDPFYDTVPFLAPRPETARRHTVVFRRHHEQR